MNVAAAVANESESDTDNNRDSWTTWVGPVADLQITKTGPTSATSADLIVDTLEVVNVGPGPAPNVAIADTLPAGHVFASAPPRTGDCTPAGS